MTPIQIIPRRARNTLESVRAAAGSDRLFAADFYIAPAEAWELAPGGLISPDRDVLNVDHHADIPEMRRPVSSANLALEYLESWGEEFARHVVINHLDCDSVLSAGLLSGRLQPDHRYGAAAIAADHTGEETEIADLLQGLDAHWSRTGRLRDGAAVEYFLDCLDRLETGRPLDDFAQAAVARRKRSRDAAAEMVSEGRFRREGAVALAELDEPIEGELFLPLMSQVVLIATMNPHREQPGRYQVKLRLGPQAPEDLSLHQLQIPQFDPGFGGRWNAGSNNRGGGTEIQPADYLSELSRRLDGAIRDLASGSSE
jgi:hypothetical protein